MIGPPAMLPGAPPQAAPPMLHDCVIQRSKKQGRAIVAPVPPEEFGIERNARSIADCNYCFHRPPMTEGKAIAQGYDEKQIKALPSYWGGSNTEEIQRDTVNESQDNTDTTNSIARPIDLIEHYIRMDYEGDGKPRLYKVTTGGAGGEVLRKSVTDEETGKTTKREDIEEVDAMPFAAMTPVIVTHRFFGRSIADLVMDIQRIKTALLRGMLDNTYLANNPRVEVAESGATVDTLDDLLVARPGGIVRTKQIGSIQWQEVPDRTAAAMPALEYMDQTREMRTGVTRQGQGIDADALRNQSATAVSQVYSMSQGRIRLVAKIFAETGIKDLFLLLHGLIRKHGSEPQTVQLRKKWVEVDPRGWKTRNDMTVHVGLGDGSKSEQLSQVSLIGNMQKEMLMGGKSNLVSDANLFGTAKQMVKLVGLKDVTKYFTDPATVPPPQAPPDPAMVKAQADMQAMRMKAQLEQEKSQADTQHQIAKTQADVALAERKHQLDKEMKEFQAALDAQKAEREHSYKIAELSMKASEKAAAPAVEVKHSAGDVTGPVGEIVGKLAEHMTNLHATHTHALLTAIQAPKRRTIVRDASGRATHADEVAM